MPLDFNTIGIRRYRISHEKKWVQKIEELKQRAK